MPWVSTRLFTRYDPPPAPISGLTCSVVLRRYRRPLARARERRLHRSDGRTRRSQVYPFQQTVCRNRSLARGPGTFRDRVQRWNDHRSRCCTRCRRYQKRHEKCCDRKALRRKPLFHGQDLLPRVGPRSASTCCWLTSGLPLASSLCRGTRQSAPTCSLQLAKLKSRST